MPEAFQDSNITVITDKFKNPVKIDNNPAHIDGALTAAEQFQERTGHFQTLTQQGAVVTDAGKWIVDDPQAVPFVMKELPHARTYKFSLPCPPTATRFADYNADLAARTPAVPASPAVTLTVMPTAHSRNVTVNEFQG